MSSFIINPYNIIPSNVTTSYRNGQGDRTGSITITTTATISSGTINNLIDGVYAGNATDGVAFNSGQSTREIKFDFGSGVVIQEGRMMCDRNSNHGTWIFEGSNDDASYTQQGSSFTFGNVICSWGDATNQTSYRYYKLRQTSGTTSSSPWMEEIEFKMNGAVTTDDTAFRGDRTGSITASTTATLGFGTASNLVDGDHIDNSSGAIFFNPGGQSSKEFKFDFGTGKVITGFQAFFGATFTHGTFTAEGSNDDASYTALDTGFALGTSTTTCTRRTWANSTAYRYFKLRQTAGTLSGSADFIEVEFLIN